MDVYTYCSRQATQFLTLTLLFSLHELERVFYASVYSTFFSSSFLIISLEKKNGKSVEERKRFVFGSSHSTTSTHRHTGDGRSRVFQMRMDLVALPNHSNQQKPLTVIINQFLRYARLLFAKIRLLIPAKYTLFDFLRSGSATSIV